MANLVDSCRIFRYTRSIVHAHWNYNSKYNYKIMFPTAALTTSFQSPPLYPRSHNRLTVWDYVVVAVFLVVSASFGVYYGIIRGRQNQSQAAYFLGERQLGIAPVAFSLMASFFSALAFVRAIWSTYLYFSCMWLMLSPYNS